jgi:hypothetical protein
MSWIGDLMDRLLRREASVEMSEIEPLPEIRADPDRLLAAKRRSSNLDQRYVVIQRVLSDYRAQDGALIKRSGR